MPKTDKQITGAWGESAARDFLRRKGYRIVAENYRKKYGELDIVAWRVLPHFGKTLCFVEVKTRALDDGSGARSVGHEKLARLKLAALGYCLDNGIDRDGTPIQFESVIVVAGGVDPVFRHYVIPVE